MSLDSTLAVISSIFLFAPIILILAFKLFNNRSFLALGLYYLLSGLYNLISQNIFDTSAVFSRSLGILANLLDAPLMLLFLTFFSTSVVMKKRITVTIIIFLVFETIVLLIYGFSVQSVKIILAPDIAVIIALSFLFFMRNVRLAVTNLKSLGKAIIASSVLVYYTIFTVAYIFFYFFNNKQYRHDAEVVYYLVTILSVALISAGIIIENKRIRKLGELKNTRKELATIYGKTRTAGANNDGRFLKTGY